jgi:predicted metal-binding membrane protein
MHLYIALAWEWSYFAWLLIEMEVTMSKGNTLAAGHNTCKPTEGRTSEVYQFNALADWPLKKQETPIFFFF